MKHIHLIGIGGIGVSALARAYLHAGYAVSGSDSGQSELTKALARLGANIYYQHRDSNIPPQTELVIYSEAISKDNPELKAAFSRQIKTITYFQGVGELTTEKYTIAIAGTHGKTTTTAMTALNLIHGDLDPKVIIGSKMKEWDNSNFRAGNSDFFVVEACEYRESFLHLSPRMVLLTNVEVDHLDYYRDQQHYTQAFIKFIQSIPATGTLIIHQTDCEANKVAEYAQCQVIKVSPNLSLPQLKVPGAHNLANARLASAAASRLGIDQQIINKSLSAFTGTWRRFELIGEKDGVLVVDDYGHHPTEIKATLLAAREAYPKRRIIIVFQPHQFSRTYRLLNDFKTAFTAADLVLVPNIYEARDTEQDKRLINAQKFSLAVAANHPQVLYTQDFEKTVEKLKLITKKGDVIITMGAGNVGEIGRMFLG